MSIGPLDQRSTTPPASIIPVAYLLMSLKKGMNMKAYKRGLTALAMGMALMGMGTVHAVEIDVADVTASSTFHTYSVENLINGAGLTGGLHSGNWIDKWLTNGTVTGSLTFDFGSTFNVATTNVWNYGPGCCGDGRSVKDLGISYSTNGVDFTSFSNFVLTQPVTDPFAAQTLNLGFNARYVQFSLNSNYGDSYTGLSEVKFFTSAVPEPETYAMLLAGLGLLGAVARRRKAAQQ